MKTAGCLLLLVATNSIFVSNSRNNSKDLDGLSICSCFCCSYIDIKNSLVLGESQVSLIGSCNGAPNSSLENKGDSEEELILKLRVLLGQTKIEEALVLQRDLIAHISRDSPGDIWRIKKEQAFMKDLKKIATLEAKDRGEYLLAAEKLASGINLINKMDFKKAEVDLNESLGLFDKLLGEVSLHKADAVEQLGFLYLYIGDYRKSKDFYTIHKKMWSAYVGENGGSLALCLRNLGVCLLRLDDFDGAESALRDAADKELQINDNKKSLNYALCLALLSEVLIAKSKRDEAKELAFQAIAIAEKYSAGGFVCLGHCFSNLARIDLHKKEEKECAANLATAVTFFKLSPPDRFTTIELGCSVIETIKKYALSLHKQGLLEEEKTINGKAESIREHILTKRKGKYSVDSSR